MSQGFGFLNAPPPIHFLLWKHTHAHLLAHTLNQHSVLVYQLYNLLGELKGKKCNTPNLIKH